MNFEDLEPIVNSYKKSQEDITLKRKLWQEQVKPLLQSTLKQVAERFKDLGLFTQSICNRENFESIILIINAKPSGITEKTHNPLTGTSSLKSFVKKGAGLNFAQSYNGNVFVLITYPSIEEILTPNENVKLLKTIDVKDIDTSFILEQVQEFFKEMTKFTNNTPYDPIGFK